MCSALLITKVSPTNLSQRKGVGVEPRAFTSNSSIKMFAVGANGGPHSCILDLLIILTLEMEVSVGEADLQ